MPAHVMIAGATLWYVMSMNAVPRWPTELEAMSISTDWFATGNRNEAETLPAPPATFRPKIAALGVLRLCTA